jgi:hypothetical protein
MVFGKKGAVRVEWEGDLVDRKTGKRIPIVIEPNATLHQLISEVKRPLWAAAAYSRLDELEAVVLRARQLVEAMKGWARPAGEYDDLVDALAKVGEGGRDDSRALG